MNRAKSKFSGLRHVRGIRLDMPWTIYHVRTSTIDKKPWLMKPGCANIFIDSLYKFRSILDFRLLAFVVMPEHVHIVLMPTEVAGLSKILMNLKRHSAWLLNRRLHRKGGFWLDDFFDHWARDRKQVAESIEYLHNNPVRRGLVSKPEEYPYSSYLAWEQPENSRYQVDRELFW